MLVDDQEDTVVLLMSQSSLTRVPLKHYFVLIERWLAVTLSKYLWYNYCILTLFTGVLNSVIYIQMPLHEIH